MIRCKFMRFSLLVALFIFTSISSASIRDVPYDQQQIIDQVSQLLLAEDFKKLNELAHEYRIKKSRTANGSWKLDAFYLGIAHLADIHNQNELFWEGLEHKTKKWIERFPRSPAAHITHAMVLSRHGWMLRGIDYPRINPENWLAYFNYNKIALQHLEKHRAIASVDPNWYEEMAWVASSLNWDKANVLKILEQGIEQEPTFPHLHLNLLRRNSENLYFEPDSIQNFNYAATDIIEKLDKFTVHLWLIFQPALPKIHDTVQNIVNNYPAYVERWTNAACDTLNNLTSKNWSTPHDPRLIHIQNMLNAARCKNYK